MGRGETVVVVAQLIESYSSVRRTKQRGGGIVEVLGAGGAAVGRGMRRGREGGLCLAGQQTWRVFA